MIYLDNAATTPINKDVLDAMNPYFDSFYGNASSVHGFGRDARLGVERARGSVARFLGAKDSEIVFTSSASEANNLAIKGVVEYLYRNQPENSEPLEVIASPVEHPCVMESLRHIEQLGWAKIIWLPVDTNGSVSAQEVQQLISDNTVLVTVMYVNNEIGTLMPINEIAAVIRSVKKSRLDLPLYFHTDAVQAVQYFKCNVNDLGVDLLSCSAHKLHGPKGSGALYVRDGIQLVRQIDGGGQEYYKRGGTENVPGIVGFGAAIEVLRSKHSDLDIEIARIKNFQSLLSDFVLKNIPYSHLTGHPVERAPHITSFLFENVDPEALVIALDREGVAVSSGSACSSGVVRQSHVIDSLHLKVPKKSAALRVSTSGLNSEDDIRSFLPALQKTVENLRTMGI